MRSSYRAQFLMATIATSCLVAGCGESEKPFDIVPATGKITYEDGSPIPDVTVQFVPQTPPIDAKTFPRPGIAEITQDGTIELVTTYDYGDGLVPGKHKVIVMSKSGQPNVVDSKYSSASTTPLEVDTADIPFDIQIEKP